MSSRNIKMIVEYDGGRYDGWTRLGKGESENTVSNKLVEVLRKMTDEDIELFAALRTEKGVHAHCQVVNFKTNVSMKCYEIRNYLNRYLPRDIAVTYVCEVPERFHSTLNAKSRTYMYRVDTREVSNVFDRKYTYYSFDKPDVKAMKEAAEHIVGTYDFKHLSTAKKNKSTVRTVKSIDIYDDGEELTISIKADDFLHNMARIIIDILLKAGSGELTPEAVGLIVEGKDYSYEPVPAQAQGLFLENVEY